MTAPAEPPMARYPEGADPFAVRFTVYSWCDWCDESTPTDRCLECDAPRCAQCERCHECQARDYDEDYEDDPL